MSDNVETAVLAGGCFWIMQQLLRNRDGVISTRVGWTGGENDNPTEQDNSGHAEAVEVAFDPDRISYRDLLEFFFQVHRPDLGERLVGSSYRSEIAGGLPQPACVGLMSPWVDLTLTSATLDSKADVDPLLSVQALRRRADDYVTPADARAASPLFADLSGLAPLLVQAGTHDILLGDALGLARRVAEYDGRVGLDI